MKTISSTLTILGIVTLLGGLPSVVNAEPSPKPVVRGGAKYFKNLEVSNVNKRDYERLISNDNQIFVTYPSFTLKYSNTQSQNNNELTGINANGTPQYTYNNQGVVVLPLGDKKEAIPYNNQGDASLQLTRLRFGAGK